MRARRQPPPAPRPPSRRLQAGRFLGGIFGLVGLLCVPAAYFQLIARDPRCRSVSMFLLLLIFFPCLSALLGLLIGAFWGAVVDLTRHDRTTDLP
jgi:ABC-type transport system involved in cytochrome c biogenesis permease subunit